MQKPSSRDIHAVQHKGQSVQNALMPLVPDLLSVGSRRWFLQTGLAGLAGLTFVDTLRLRASTPGEARAPKAVILFWLSGGPSQLDTWDPKPDAPAEIRGPYRTIATRIPGIHVCEHLPLQARIMDRLTILRAVDCSASDHTPITMQVGNPLARRTNDGRDGDGYPAMGAVASRFRGANAAGMPAFVGLANSWRADVWGAGHLGPGHAPVNGLELPGRLALPTGVKLDCLQDRVAILRQFDQFRHDLDTSASTARMDRHGQMALNIITSRRVQDAFAVDREPERLRDLYGRCSVGEKALLARRMVEAGTTFVLVSGRWGYFDHHGDDVPPWGGIQRGLTPILPTIDRALYALVTDLEARGLLDSTLILMLGEFGRSPVLTPDNGRGHWTNVMSMVMAGGGFRHGQVIGATDRRGGDIRERRVGPSDLAATVFQHLGIPLDATWTNLQGRPIPIVAGGGQPIGELG
jgi:hypothetical protein